MAPAKSSQRNKVVLSQRNQGVLKAKGNPKTLKGKGNPKTLKAKGSPKMLKAKGKAKAKAFAKAPVLKDSQRSETTINPIEHRANACEQRQADRVALTTTCDRTAQV